jgi:hypothetical protein
MHPELLRALGHARHDDLLKKGRNRQPSVRSDRHAPRFARSRQRVGSLLISAGARLVDDRRATIGLAHKQ